MSLNLLRGQIEEYRPLAVKEVEAGYVTNVISPVPDVVRA